MASVEQQKILTALDHVPLGSRVLTLVGHSCGKDWAFDRNDHLGGLVIERRLGFSNEQWIVAGANLLTLRDAAAFGKFAMDPSQQAFANDCTPGLASSIDRSLAQFPRAGFDYVWLIDPPGRDERPTNDMTPVWRSGSNVLYRIER